MNLVASGISIQGAWHKSINLPNEDAILVDETHGLFAAVDGVSTKPRGDVAAQLVVEALARVAENEPGKQWLEKAFMEAEDAIEQFAAAEKLLACPKACVTTVWLREGSGGNHIGLIGHAGDTTALLVNHTTGTITQLTTPHNVWDGRQFRVTRYVGGRKKQPDIGTVVVPPNCTLLVVTDGVTKKLTARELCTKTLYTVSPQELVYAIVRLAHIANEADDISVIAVRTLRL